MGLSDEAKRRAAESRRKYDQENMCTVAAKLPRTDAEAFREYAWRRGTSVSALLIAYIRRTLQEEVTYMSTAKQEGRVTITLRPTTLAAIEKIAQETNVAVDHLVDAALAEFVAKWEARK
jgi:hypothetical protein